MVEARQPVKFPPILNGLDYLESAAALLAEVEPAPAKNLKYAVLHLAAGVETLLKARIALKDEKLVWTKSDQYDPVKHQRGDFKSVQWREAHKLVMERCQPTVCPAELHHVQALAGMRNRFAHIGVAEEAAITVEVLTTPILDSMLAFAEDELLPLAPAEQREEAAQTVARIWPLVGKIRPVVEARLQPARDLHGQNLVWVLSCPDCASPSIPLTVDSRSLACVVCPLELGPPTEAAWYYTSTSAYETARDGGSEVWNCGDCGQLAATYVTTALPERLLICLACTAEHHGACAHCEQAVGGYTLPDSRMCAECAGDALARL